MKEHRIRVQEKFSGSTELFSQDRIRLHKNSAWSTDQGNMAKNSPGASMNCLVGPFNSQKLSISAERSARAPRPAGPRFVRGVGTTGDMLTRQWSKFGRANQSSSFGGCCFNQLLVC